MALFHAIYLEVTQNHTEIQPAVLLKAKPRMADWQVADQQMAGWQIGRLQIGRLADWLDWQIGRLADWLD